MRYLSLFLGLLLSAAARPFSAKAHEELEKPPQRASEEFLPVVLIGCLAHAFSEGGIRVDDLGKCPNRQLLPQDQRTPKILKAHLKLLELILF